jgi:hypothetical protein
MLNRTQVEHLAVNTFGKDLQTVANIFFKPIVLTDEQKSKATPEFKETFTEFITKADSIEWKADKVKQLIYEICNEKPQTQWRLRSPVRIQRLLDKHSGPISETETEVRANGSCLGKEAGN